MLYPPPVPVYRTRYAPSPTGKMHLGHARSALVAWLQARHQGGRIVLRIEDLDPPRVRPKSAEAIQRDHEWLGLDWDEGPFFQSERYGLYEAALKRLQEQGSVYPCTCSRKEWLAAASSAPHIGEGPPLYPGTCRQGPTHPERRPAWRFAFDEAETFVDGIHGEVAAPTVSDFILKRSDGLWAYQLAVVVDDAAMGITEVIRGDDLLSSTAPQLALYDALGAPRPNFAHVPLVLGSDGVRLAKRHGAVGVSDYREAGVSREAILGMLGASLGLLEDGSKGASLEGLLARFAAAQSPLMGISKEPFTLMPLEAQ